MRRLVRIALVGLLGLAAGLVLLALAYRVLPPVSTLMIGRWLTGGSVSRQAVPLEAMGAYLPRAVLASEDARFCEHGGVDWEALRQVIEDAEDGAPSRGASTIPMQTAKNLFLWPSRSYVRKGLEIPLALALDVVWPKRRILENYLNVAEWGEGIFGAEAAARHHFGKPAAALTRREAALLATALPNPLRRDPRRASPGHRRLADRLVGRMDGTSTGCLRG